MLHITSKRARRPRPPNSFLLLFHCRVEGAAVYRRSKAWRFPALLAGAVAAALRAVGRQQGVTLGVLELPDVVRSLLQVHCRLCAKECIAHSILTASRPMLGAGPICTQGTCRSLCSRCWLCSSGCTYETGR